MLQTVKSATLLAIILSSLTVFTPLSASAREGAQSVGKGIKCYTAYTQNADGTYSWKQICYKSI